MFLELMPRLLHVQIILSCHLFCCKFAGKGSAMRSVLMLINLLHKHVFNDWFAFKYCQLARYFKNIYTKFKFIRNSNDLFFICWHSSCYFLHWNWNRHFIYFFRLTSKYQIINVILCFRLWFNFNFILLAKTGKNYGIIKIT